MSTQKNTYVLYHGDCFDGFGAAWAAYQWFGYEAEYIAVLHGKPMPDIPDGATVFILDFSYPRADLVALSKRCALKVLDHHASAKEALEGLDFATFDLNKSGARIAWEYFHPGEDIPGLLEYIEDRDLWRWALPQSREVAAAMRLYPFDFATWDFLAWPGRMDGLKTEGEVCLRCTKELVKTIAQEAAFLRVGGHWVPVVNAPLRLTSEVCEELLSRHQGSLFVAAYCDRADGVRQWGLRSRGDFDCSQVAIDYGGGGHKASAGFQSLAPTHLPAPLR